MGMTHTDITPAMLADKRGAKRETFYRLVRRTFGKGVGMDTPLSAEQLETLSGRGRIGRTEMSAPYVRKPRTSTPIAKQSSATEKPETREMSVISSGFSAIGEGVKRLVVFVSALDTYLKAIIYAHAALVLADLVILYSTPGAIAGVLVGMFMHAATKLAGRQELFRTSGFAMFVVFVLDSLAWFVHVPAFRASLSADVSDIVTQVLAGVVCAMSFAALYVLRDSKLD